MFQLNWTVPTGPDQHKDKKDDVNMKLKINYKPL